MVYQVNDGNGAYTGEPRSLPNRGPKPRYPFNNMYVGQWIEVPYSEEHMLLRAVRNIRRKGLYFELFHGREGYWRVFRVR